ncbi:MAG: flagellar biosynthesis anti-sigma factor FlgM [Firmicutes bacterium HGW-Firmicutes-1]|jgi:negative regulator of flagellin synthesis FlgM|nr:MAG: flagellar biosynthesis anti-sigma factor FlgM [Firmicutes bacterium HGW-Firmicutes-1]
MRINGINNVNNIYKSNKTNKAYSASGVSTSKDTLAISNFAKELQVATQAVNNAPDIRQSKVDEIKQQMEAGKYNISASQLADKLLNKNFE